MPPPPAQFPCPGPSSGLHLNQSFNEWVSGSTVGASAATAEGRDTMATRFGSKSWNVRLAGTLAAAGFALVAPADRARADIIADFTGGNGTASSDQWTGVSGNGWATGWGSVGSTTGTGVVNTTPLSGGDNYLQFVDDATNASVYARRQYSASGNVNPAQPHRITLSYRYDGNTTTQFGHFNDRIAVFGDSAAQTSSSATNTWLIGVAASNTGTGAGQSVFPGNWYFFDNNGSNAFATTNMVNTGISLVGGRVYDITLDVNPNVGTYSATVNDGVNAPFTANDLTFRRGAGAATTNWFHLTGQNDVATDSGGFSFDSVRITPEPSAAAFALAGVAGALGARRRRHAPR